MFRRRSRSGSARARRARRALPTRRTTRTTEPTARGTPRRSRRRRRAGRPRLAAGGAARGRPRLRLQVDEQTGEVQSVMLAGEDGALELRAFAAPRNGDLWTRGPAADRRRRRPARRHGHRARRPLGRRAGLPDAGRHARRHQAMQPSRIVGVNGGRWLLRATFLGRPAVEPDDAEAWEDALAAVVVHRGTHAMPVGDALPLVLPGDAATAPPQGRPKADYAWSHGREEQAASHDQQVGQRRTTARPRAARRRRAPGACNLIADCARPRRRSGCAARSRP